MPPVLPTEIWVQIFGYLPFFTLHNGLKPVCRQFHDIINYYPPFTTIHGLTPIIWVKIIRELPNYKDIIRFSMVTVGFRQLISQSQDSFILYKTFRTPLNRRKESLKFGSTIVLHPFIKRVYMDEHETPFLKIGPSRRTGGIKPLVGEKAVNLQVLLTNATHIPAEEIYIDGLRIRASKSNRASGEPAAVTLLQLLKAVQKGDGNHKRLTKDSSWCTYARSLTARLERSRLGIDGRIARKLPWCPPRLYQLGALYWRTSEEPVEDAGEGASLVDDDLKTDGRDIPASKSEK